jgi:hypothetical protein
MGCKKNSKYITDLLQGTTTEFFWIKLGKLKQSSVPMAC